MKRLIIISMLLIGGVVQADDEAVQPIESQSSGDASSKNSTDSIQIANVHHINLDTTQVDGGGNWLNKRIWYERAQAIFDEIRVQLNSLSDVRVKFSHEVQNVGDKIELFFENVMFTKGQLEEKFQEILTMLDNEQKMVGDLSVDERALQDSIKKELPNIEQIGRDIKSIGDIDNKIDQTFTLALKTMDECRDIETKSWSLFKDIGKELDDKKARNLYYQMSNYKQNIEQKIQYLKSTLLPYLHNVLIAKVEMNISKINVAMSKLRSKGIDVAKIMNDNEDTDIIRLHNRQKKETQIAVEKALEEEQAKAKQAAQIAKEALDQANKKSFSNVVNGYYKATIGRFMDALKIKYLIQGLQYSGQIATNFTWPFFVMIYNQMLNIRWYMHHVVVSIMNYFHKKPSAQVIPAVHVEDVAVVPPVVAPMVKDTLPPVVKQSVIDTSAMHGNATATPLVSLTDLTHKESVKSDSVKNDQVKVDQKSDAKVVVQMIQDHEELQQRSLTSFFAMVYQGIQFIWNAALSIYNAIFDFLSFIIQFFMYGLFSRS